MRVISRSFSVSHARFDPRCTASWQKRKWKLSTPPRESPLIQPLVVVVVVRQVQKAPFDWTWRHLERLAGLQHNLRFSPLGPSTHHQHGRSSTNVVSPLAHIINTPSKPQPTTQLAGVRYNASLTDISIGQAVRNASLRQAGARETCVEKALQPCACQTPCEALAGNLESRGKVHHT